MIKDVKNSMIQVGLAGVLSFGAISVGFAAASMDQLPQFVLNLGGYFGYDLNTSPTSPTSSISTMPENKSIKEALETAVKLYLGTIIAEPIVDGQSPLNSKSNKIFKSQSDNTNSSEPASANKFISPLVDQTPYQNNPINQTILNTLTTPDYSYCKQITNCTTGPDSSGSGGTDLASRCCGKTGRAQYQIGSNIIGTIPGPLELFNALDPSVLTQLNGNTLIDPLLYSTAKNAGNTGSTLNTPPLGLEASTQAQEAENFIRYVTGSVAPAPKTKEETYQALWNVAMTPLPANPTTAQMEQAAAAQGALSTYLASLRVFAAQTSVGVGNLYYIFSKRMSQTPGSSPATSQALNEYTMATRRLYDPTKDEKSQWVAQINNASPATVQKEMAVLLSEINYQLYLTRQQQERLLLTNTVMLFQLGHLVEPPPLQPPSQ